MEPEHWIEAATAKTLLVDTHRLGEHLRAGLIKGRAKHFVIDRERRDNVILPQEFWRAEGVGSLKEDWNTGDFSTWSDQRQEMQAFGVRFDLSGLLTMLPAEHRSHAALTCSVAGNPKWMSFGDVLKKIRQSKECDFSTAVKHLVHLAQLNFLVVRAVRAHGSSEDLLRWNWALAAREWDVPAWFWRWTLDRFEMLDQTSVGSLVANGTTPNGVPAEITLTGVYVSRQSLVALGIDPAEHNMERQRDEALPRLPDAELKRWWNKLEKSRDQLSEAQLLILVRGEHPSNFIARDRLRELIGPRKTGPK